MTRKSVRFSNRELEEIEKIARKEDRTFSQQVRHWTKRGIREDRERREQDANNQ